MFIPPAISRRSDDLDGAPIWAPSISAPTRLRCLASGGNGTYAWSLQSGTLPPGMADQGRCSFVLRRHSAGWPDRCSHHGRDLQFHPGVYQRRPTAAAQAFATLRVTALTTRRPEPAEDVFVGVPLLLHVHRCRKPRAAVSFSPVSPPVRHLSLERRRSFGNPGDGRLLWIQRFDLSDGTDTEREFYTLNVFAVQVTRRRGLLFGTERMAAPITSPSPPPAGTPSSYTWALLGGLPNGLALSSAGAISGTVAANAGAGPYTFQVSATDGNSASYTKWMSIDIIGIPPTLQRFNFGEVDDAVMGNRFSYQLAPCCGGTAPFVGTASGLPTGLAVRSAATAASPAVMWRPATWRFTALRRSRAISTRR